MSFTSRATSSVQPGVEQTYDSILRGNDGSRDVVVNSHGKEIGQLGNEPSVPGKSCG